MNNLAPLPEPQSTYYLVFHSGFWVVWMVLLFTGQVFFAKWFTREKSYMKTIWPVLWTYLPWGLGFLLPLAVKVNLPDPHNTPIRKMEILLGVILISHLFLYCRLLLSGSYKKGWKESKIFASAGAILFCGATLWTATVCDLSGDEPHYLLMAYSLIHDGDLDLSNNFANRDYENFYQRGELQPQGLDHQMDGKIYSHHPLGPVLLVLPGFILAGRIGAALTMALLAALALYLTLRVLEETGAKGWPLHAVGIVGLASSPFLLFSGLIFPEIPTACLVALSPLLYLRKHWLGFGLCLGLMLWMHNRNVLLIIPLLAFALYEILQSKDKARQAGRLCMGFLPPLAALGLYFHSIYGVWTPLGAHNEPFSSLFRLGHFWDGFFGLLLDQECGLWFHFPIFAMAVTGGIVLAHSKKPLRWMILGTLVFYYVFMSFYENLGLTPATRYMVGVIPLLLMTLYPAVEKLKKRDIWTSLTMFSFAAGALVNWLLAAVPWMRYNKLNGENWILKIGGSFLDLPLTSWEPAFQAPIVEMKSYLISAFWVIATVLLSVLFLKEKKN